MQTHLAWGEMLLWINVHVKLNIFTECCRFQKKDLQLSQRSPVPAQYPTVTHHHLQYQSPTYNTQCYPPNFVTPQHMMTQGGKPQLFGCRGSWYWPRQGLQCWRIIKFLIQSAVPLFRWRRYLMDLVAKFGLHDLREDSWKYHTKLAISVCNWWNISEQLWFWKIF